MSKIPDSPSAVADSYAATLHVRDHCLCLNVQRAARVLARHFDDAFRPLGLTSGQFSLLNALNRPEPPTMGAVARLLAMDRTTLTAALKPLDRDGLARVTPDACDRRSRRLVLTDRGREKLAEATAIWREAHARLDAVLAEHDGQPGADLPAALRLLTASLEAPR